MSANTIVPNLFQINHTRKTVCKQLPAVVICVLVLELISPGCCSVHNNDDCEAKMELTVNVSDLKHRDIASVILKLSNASRTHSME